MAEEELSAKLARRQAINEGQAGGEQRKVFNPYTEFPKVRAALGPAAADSEDETYLSDSEMLKLDDAISEAFLQRAQPNKKKDKLKEEQTQNHFRMRCLELLSIYVKKEPKLKLVLLTVEPLVLTAKLGIHNQKLESLSKKACGVLQTIAGVKKVKDMDEVQQKDLQELLNFLLTTFQKVSDLKIKNILIHLCSFAISCSQVVAKAENLSDKDRKELIEWYFQLCKELLTNYFEKNSLDLSPKLFDTLFLTCASRSSELLDFLETSAFDITKRLFKRTKALTLITLILQKIGVFVPQNNYFLTEFCVRILQKAIEAVREIVQSSIKPAYASVLLQIISILLHDRKVCCVDLSSEQKNELLNLLNQISLKKLEKKGRKAAHKIRAKLNCRVAAETEKRFSDDNTLILSNTNLQKKRKKEA